MNVTISWIPFLIICWSMIGFIIGIIASDELFFNEKYNRKQRYFLSFVCGPVVFVIGTLILIFVLLSDAVTYILDYLED